MLKKVALPVIALLGIAAVVPNAAKAEERHERVERIYRPVHRDYDRVVIETPAPVYHRWVRHEFRRDWDRR